MDSEYTWSRAIKTSRGEGGEGGRRGWEEREGGRRGREEREGGREGMEEGKEG